MIIVSIDVEASGPIVTKHAMIQLGAVAFDSETGEVLSCFLEDINMPEGIEWDQKCLVEFWDNDSYKKLPDNDERKKEEERIYIQKQNFKNKINNGEGKDPVDVMKLFLVWLKIDVFRNLAHEKLENIELTVDTGGFDTTFINYYLAVFANHNPLHLFFGDFKDIVNTDDVYRGMVNLSLSEIELYRKTKGWISWRELAAKGKQPLKISEFTHDHNALNDAKFIGYWFCVLCEKSLHRNK